MKSIFVFWVSSLILAIPQGLSAQGDTTFIATGDPTAKHRSIADPTAMVHDGRMYIHGGHNGCPLPEEYYNLKEWCVFSSSDSETWIRHAVPLEAKDLSWVKDEAWASQAVERDDEFYWYVMMGHKTIPSKSIGIAVSNSSIRPFIDVRGSALTTSDTTTNRSKSYWDGTDPTVFIDNDEQTYLYWDSSQCYFTGLEKSMVELDGSIIPVDLPYFIEALQIHKKGDRYYLSYTSEPPEKICYTMNRSIMGPWEYKGILDELTGSNNTNHQAITGSRDN